MFIQVIRNTKIFKKFLSNITFKYQGKYFVKYERIGKSKSTFIKRWANQEMKKHNTKIPRDIRSLTFHIDSSICTDFTLLCFLHF